MKLPPQDKLAHCIVGTFIFAICNFFLCSCFALGIVIIAGLMKEIYDYFNPITNTAELQDFCYTLLGGVIGYMCTLKLESFRLTCSLPTTY